MRSPLDLTLPMLRTASSTKVHSFQHKNEPSLVVQFVNCGSRRDTTPFCCQDRAYGLFTVCHKQPRPSIEAKKIMQQTLWGEMKPQRPKKNKARRLTQAPPYSITGANDCETIGHTLSVRDLAGCTTCSDCGVSVFCPTCTPKHPTDENAIPIPCFRHEES
jgi:hypothetical protein